ncbi:hypothetical protein [Polyangium jinanense]|uniref:Uncharacterized protein n=1 Tax=Polyangium jinanense TaxID=2829994 RepID=A0A9X3X986_9BACT|nr:hypothetical protein [Polyangium jinanense]MDC3955983.1 hypothetical protein [Polyangium jinanense]MDC3955989.1 hypothetical protein [Polyangium jinanense]MDC3961504.1 hypothetical protein [Polyangium jinanense]MDC3986349.1 hypothetical protein [Polyangium jinanense]
MKTRALVFLAAATIPLAAPASATTKKECVASYEQTQSLRKEGKLASAQEAALVCSHNDCPRVVRKDCTEWLAEIEKSLPTVVLVARDEKGDETADVRVFEGDKLVRERLDGKAMPMDPGEHVLRFERDGAEPVTRKVIVHEGDKLVRIEASFKKEPKAPEEKPAEKGSGVPIAPIVIGGVGILGLGAAGVIGLLGLSAKSDLEASCAPRCTDAAVDPIRTKFLAADITAAASVVLLGTAAVVYFTSGSRDEQKSAMPRIEFAPTIGGGFLSLRGAF